MTTADTIAITRALFSIVSSNLDKEAQDPQTAGVVGEPVPAETVQGGAEQMVPPPGAAVGAPAPQGSPDGEALAQIGSLIEQAASAIIELMTRGVDAIERAERQLILLTGQALEPPAAPTPAATPKVAGAESEPELPAGFFKSTGGDGVAGVPLTNVSNRDKIAQATTLAGAILAIQNVRDS